MRRKLVVFVGINLVIALLAALAPISMIASNEYSRQVVVFEYIDSLGPGDTVKVIVGDSRSECCIAARDLGYINLSLAGSTSVEGFYLLNRILEQGATIDRVIVSYGPFHIVSQDTFYSFSRYLRLIDESYLDQVSALAIELDDQQYQRYQWRALEVIDETLPFLPDALKFSLVNILSIDNTAISMFETVTERVGGEDSDERLIADPRYKLHEVASSRRANRGTDSPELLLESAVSPVNEYYLGEIVRLARHKDFGIHFLVMPFNQDMKQPSAAFFDRVESVIEHSGFWNCYSGIEFWPNEYFFDPSHINELGAQKFNNGLDQRLSFCRGSRYRH